MARGATTFSKLRVQFLGLGYYYPSTEKIRQVYPVWCSRLHIHTLFIKKLCKKLGVHPNSGEVRPPDRQRARLRHAASVNCGTVYWLPPTRSGSRAAPANWASDVTARCGVELPRENLTTASHTWQCITAFQLRYRVLSSLAERCNCIVHS